MTKSRELVSEVFLWDLQNVSKLNPLKLLQHEDKWRLAAARSGLQAQIGISRFIHVWLIADD